MESLRDALPNVQIASNLGGGSMRSQMRRADRSQAKFALIMCDNELEEGVVTLKDLREDGEQDHIEFSEIAQWLTENMAN